MSLYQTFVSLSWPLFVSAIFISCSSSPSKSVKYPSHWFTPVSTDGAPAWEILPQAAKPGEVILSKRNELGILSNFAPTPFTYRGKKYASVEGFWQMLKYPEGPKDERRKPGLDWPYTRDEVANMVAFQAKAAGKPASANMEKLGIDWVTFEGKKIPYREQAKGDFYKLIYEVELEKLKQNPKVKEVLLQTGTLVLRPDHHEEPGAAPAWRYYEIWTEIRDQLQSQVIR